MLGGGTADQINYLEIYGKNIGLAFQITDDLLNVEGDPAIMGKAVGTDIRRKKTTYPSVLGFESAKKLAVHLVNDALHALDCAGIRSDPFRAIAKYIIERKQ
jgi:geranylgeranyl diphosphate synthase type II